MNNSHNDEDTTHFGYEQVEWEEKAGRVAGVFDSVATRKSVV